MKTTITELRRTIRRVIVESRKPPMLADGSVSQRGDVEYEVWAHSLQDFQAQVRKMSDSRLRAEHSSYYFLKEPIEASHPRYPNRLVCTEETAKFIIIDDEAKKRGFDV